MRCNNCSKQNLYDSNLISKEIDIYIYMLNNNINEEKWGNKSFLNLENEDIANILYIIISWFT